MAQRIETFDVTIPAGTLVAAPQVTALAFNIGVVQGIEIQVPPGPSGLVGFRIRHSGDTVIPYDRSKWIIADNDVIRWPLEGFPTGRAWSIEAYNTDVYAHTLYIRFLVSEIQRDTLARPQLVYIAPGATAEDVAPSA